MITVLGYAAGVEEPVVRVGIRGAPMSSMAGINWDGWTFDVLPRSGTLKTDSARRLLKDLWDPELRYEVKA